jgi:hypothetical protein
MGDLMAHRFIITLLLTTGLAGSYSTLGASPPVRAFPSAEGFGAFTSGGRGGRVMKVTNLNDAGPGSLRAAIDARGPRIVIFETGGTIMLQSALKIRNPNITLAGQTAPGDGIALGGHELVVEASEVIIRYIRVRVGDANRVEADAISVAAGQNIIIDHCSASCSTDETFSVAQQMTLGEKQLNNVTVQWSIISESLDQSVHSKGAHGYGSLVRGSAGSRYSFHHNLWAHHRARMPRPGNFADAATDPVGPTFDFTNNVFYNWGGGRNDGSGYNADTNAISRYNFRGNSYRTGANTLSALAFVESSTGARAHFSGNAMNGQLVSTNTIVRLKRPVGDYFSSTPFENASVTAVDPLVAEEAVLARAGASLRRDSVDARVVANVKTRTGAIINSQADVGGWPALASGTARIDTDGDGMPDDWERRNRLNPSDPIDAARDANGDGVTNIEDWMNALAP